MIDLNTCVEGQKLKSSHGLILIYAGKAPAGHYYDHLVTYPTGSQGSRTNDGYVMRNPAKRLESDHNIVEIMPVGWVKPKPERKHASYVTLISDQASVIAQYKAEAAQAKEQLEEALQWKNEDPRMLREQIRVADAAFQARPNSI